MKRKNYLSNWVKKKKICTRNIDRDARIDDEIGQSILINCPSENTENKIINLNIVQTIYVDDNDPMGN